MNTSIKKCLSIISRNYVAKPLIIAFLSIIVAYYLPDLTAGIIEKGMPDFPGTKLPKEPNFYDQVHLLSMGFILIFSCWISFYGIYGLIRLASVGYGDIMPLSGLSKLLVCLETIMEQLLLALGVASAYSGISAASKNNRVVNQGIHVEKPADRSLTL